MEVRLTITGGKADRSEVRLKLPFLIGRSHEADLTIAHPMVSRKHCEVFELQGMVRVRDLGSLNGTMVLGQTVVESPLRPQDELTVGPLTFRIDYDYPGEVTVEVASGRRRLSVGQAILDPGKAIGDPGRTPTVPASLQTTIAAAPGGVLSAPGGVLSAPGGVLSAPGGVLSAPGGVLSEVSIAPAAAAVLQVVSEAPLEVVPQESPAGGAASGVSNPPPSLFPETPPPDFITWGPPSPAASSRSVPYGGAPSAGDAPEQLEHAEPLEYAELIVIELVPEPGVAGHAPVSPAASPAPFAPTASAPNPPSQPAQASAPAHASPHEDLDDFLNSLQ